MTPNRNATPFLPTRTLSTSTLDETTSDASRLEGEDLANIRKALKDKRLVVIVGAGATLSATAEESGKPLSRLSWTGLIRNGLDYLVNKGHVDPANARTKRAKDALEDGDTDSVLDAASVLVSQLIRHRQLATWLDSVFGSLYQQVRHPDILDVLKDLHERGATLLTTNYDDLLEKHCNLNRISRSNQADILKFKRKDLDGVFHVHGSYHDSKEVVLDRTGYDQIKNSEEVQNMLKTFLESDHIILFVGCGAGLEDPNFDGLLQWARERHETLPDRHFLLVRTEDTLNYSPLRRLNYGSNYRNLVPYLRRLLDDQSQQTGVSGHASAIEPAPSIFTDEEKACLQSLSFVEVETRKHTIATALPDTSTWIFERSEYIDWVNGRNVSQHKGLLWIKGKPGSGKSVMVKNILYWAQRQQDSPALISFFFNARGGPLERKPLGLFRSLLHQLLLQHRHLLPELLSTYRTKRDTLPPNWKWQEEELREYFSDIVTRAKVSSLVIFVDALDECEDEVEIRRIVGFLAQLTSLAVPSQCEVRVCMSSRHYPHIGVPGCLEIIMEKWNTRDIHKYVDFKLCLQGALGMQFQKDVAEKASGVFLWVVLVVASLLKMNDEGGTVKQMRHILQSVPKKLDELFRDYFATVNAEDRQRTLNLMQWVLFSERPLTPMEINCALTFSVQCPPTSQKTWQESDDYLDDDVQIEKVLRALSKGLIEITQGNSDVRDSDHNKHTMPIQGNRRVQFIHESVRDFLLHDGLRLLDPSLGHAVVGDSHSHLTKACISYLSIYELHRDEHPSFYILDDWENRDELKQIAFNVVDSCKPYTFWEYALRFTFTHATKAEHGGTEQRFLAQLLHRESRSVFNVWRYLTDCLAVIEYGHVQGPETALLHIASERGLITCVFELLDWGVDVNTKGGAYHHALIAAAANGQEAIARLLLEKGADVTIQNKYGKTVLHYAAANGHEAIARLLLEKGADVKIQDEDGETALHYATGYGNETITRLLLENGADVIMQDISGKTALHYAARNRNKTITRLLLENGANISIQDKYGETALYYATEYGNETITRLLLENGVDITIQDISGKTAMSLALESGHEGMAQLLAHYSM